MAKRVQGLERKAGATRDRPGAGPPVPATDGLWVLGSEPSPFVLTSLDRIALEADASVIDLGCGAGRHSTLLAQLGYRVTAADIDARRLRQTAEAARRLPARWPISCLLADASGPLPFADASFDLVIVIDLMADGFEAELVRVLRPGGYLLLQSFGGQGENWRALPAPGQVRTALEPSCELLDYRERPVGPTRQEAASVRLLARRR